MGKKTKRESSEPIEEDEPDLSNGCSLDTKLKKKKTKKHKKGIIENENEKENTHKPNETPTVSIALPGSIIDNAQSLELATLLAGQIARAATIFRINEVVVFDSKSSLTDATIVADSSNENESGAAFLVRILKYLETPQYLRKSLFPWHNSLRYVGVLPPLDAPHHLRKHEWAPFRDGVTKERDSKSGGTLVDVGLSKDAIIDEVREPGIRVTVAMGTNRNSIADLPRQVVSSAKPREEGLYWGYNVRYAPNLSSVFKDTPFKGGYDYVIGTSEHGKFIKSSELHIPASRHLLIAFGGPPGLEECIEEDDTLKGKEAVDVFNTYLNVCPDQGSRTIRSEVCFMFDFTFIRFTKCFVLFILYYDARQTGSHSNITSVFPRADSIFTAKIEQLMISDR
ncbi:putative methyltransferase C9orf114 [Impatiens glandulifera]|uniref:putative methyltransferase C9orf114 n=1 Tax=Impatiens glandulifera TaxID=253017 RepID=UPI001FB0B414|nr:putative methyltransferase C9orf114 [Impatiens glandulifera]